MKIIKTGKVLRIFGDDLETSDTISAATYKVAFSPMSGFALIEIDNFKSIEEKIYGGHAEKIEKVLKSYSMLNRSLGVILSGNKGMGKSLFVQLIAEEVIKKGIPVIMVTEAYKGIADFIEEIDQEVLVIFDEFEKVFNGSDHVESQDNLLGLFDGTSQKKRMYAITVNNLRQVNEYMLSRTGRFHYHIRFSYPTANEIEVYLKDKIEEQYYPEISQVISFARRVNLNYDSLRAIAFELNQGYSFAASIGDLNILMTDTQRYDVKVTFSNGEVVDLKGQRLNLFTESIQLDGYIGHGDYFSVTFQPRDIIEELGQMSVSGENVEVESRDSDGDKTVAVEVREITIIQHQDVGVNYNLNF